MPDALPPVAEPLVLQFKINSSMVTRGVDGLSDDETWFQMEGTANPIAWIVGHLTESRGQMLRLLGVEWDPGWGNAFTRGSARLDRSGYPPRHAIEAKFRETHELMRDAFGRLTTERLAEATPLQIAGAKTIADLLAFFAFHEAYHLGQVGFIRKRLGHSSLAG